jgi:hypothetical protein
MQILRFHDFIAKMGIPKIGILILAIHPDWLGSNLVINPDRDPISAIPIFGILILAIVTPF